MSSSTVRVECPMEWIVRSDFIAELAPKLAPRGDDCLRNDDCLRVNERRSAMSGARR